MSISVLGGNGVLYFITFMNVCYQYFFFTLKLIDFLNSLSQIQLNFTGRFFQTGVPKERNSYYNGRILK